MQIIIALRYLHVQLSGDCSIHSIAVWKSGRVPDNTSDKEGREKVEMNLGRLSVLPHVHVSSCTIHITAIAFFKH